MNKFLFSPSSFLLVFRKTADFASCCFPESIHQMQEFSGGVIRILEKIFICLSFIVCIFVHGQIYIRYTCLVPVEARREDFRSLRTGIKDSSESLC